MAFALPLKIPSGLLDTFKGLLEKVPFKVPSGISWQIVQQNISLETLKQGMMVVGGLFLFLLLFILMTGEKAKENLQMQLATSTVVVDWQGQKTRMLGDKAIADDPAYLDIASLGEAPFEGLYEEDKLLGQLPIRRKDDGFTPFEAYRRPFDLYGVDKPLIVIVIENLGYSVVASESAIRSMPAEVTLAFSPYAKDVDRWTKDARLRGHEVWLTLPLETDTYPRNDPGPQTLLVNVPEVLNQNKLKWMMSRAAGFAGFITNGNAVFMQSLPDVRPMLTEIYSRGLAFVDNSDYVGPIPETVAYGLNAPYAKTHVKIDNPATPEQFESAFAELEKIARENGVGVGVIQTLPISYQKILRWIETFSSKGLALAPLSAATGFVYSDIDAQASVVEHSMVERAVEKERREKKLKKKTPEHKQEHHSGKDTRNTGHHGKTKSNKKKSNEHH